MTNASLCYRPLEIHAAPQFPRYSATHVERLFTTLEKNNFRLTNIERPWAWCQDSCLQVGFIHRDFHPSRNGVYAGAVPGWLAENLSTVMGQVLTFEIFTNGTEKVPDGIIRQRVARHPFLENESPELPKLKAASHFAVRWGMMNTGKATLLGSFYGLTRIDPNTWWRIFCDGCELSENFPILVETVEPGESFYPRLDFQAPAVPDGVVTATFRFETSSGVAFGEEFQISIQIVS